VKDARRGEVLCNQHSRNQNQQSAKAGAEWVECKTVKGCSKRQATERNDRHGNQRPQSNSSLHYFSFFRCQLLSSEGKELLGFHLTAKRTADRHKGSDYDLYQGSERVLRLPREIHSLKELKR
jgi:hypothetical protein